MKRTGVKLFVLLAAACAIIFMVIRLNVYPKVQLQQAVTLNDGERVKYWLERGEDVNAQYPSNEGWTFPLLQRAAQYGSVTSLDELLKHGALIDLTDNRRRRTPLMVAVADRDENHYKCVDLLVANGASINATSANRETALYIASEAGNLRNVTKLLREGADVNIITKYGENALHGVCRIKGDSADRMEIITLLIAAGINVDLTNSRGCTPRETLSSVSPELLNRFDEIIFKMSKAKK